MPYRFTSISKTLNLCECISLPGAHRHVPMQANSIAKYLSPKEKDANGASRAFTAPRCSQNKDQVEAASEVASTTSSTAIGAQRKRLSYFACPSTKRPSFLGQNTNSNLSITGSSKEVDRGFLTPTNGDSLCHDIQRLTSIGSETVHNTEIEMESQPFWGSSKKKKYFTDISMTGSEPDDDTVLSAITSPVTPRSTSFFHKSDVSPDILGDDLGIENDSDADFLGEKSLGLLRKEDNTFEVSESKRRQQYVAKQTRLQMGLRKPVGNGGKASQGFYSQTSTPPSGALGNEDLPLKEVNLTPEMIGSGAVVLGRDVRDGKSQMCKMASKTLKPLVTKENNFSIAFDSKQSNIDSRDVEQNSKEMTSSSRELGVETSKHVVHRSSDGGFHGIEHVAGFAAVARQTLDRLEGHKSVPIQSQTHTKHGRGKGNSLGRRKSTREVEKPELFSKFAYQR